MRIVLLVAIIVAVPVLVGVVAIARVRRGRHAPATPAEPPTARTDDFPAPGDPSPERHGRPVPGSAPDRHAHGKP